MQNANATGQQIKTAKLRIIIFGAARMAREILPFINLEVTEILGFVDERPQAVGKPFAGYPVMGFGALDEVEYDAVLIAVGPSTFSYMRLKHHGIPAEKIAICNFLCLLPIHQSGCDANENFAEQCIHYCATNNVLSRCFLIKKFLASDWYNNLEYRWNREKDSLRLNLAKLFVSRTADPSAAGQRIAQLFQQSPKKIIRSFSTIRIETTNICAYNCFFCGAKKMARARGVMSDSEFIELLRKLDGLKDFSGALLLHHSGDPLCDKTILNKIRLAKKFAPQASIGMNTTLGYPLPDETLDALWSSGLNRLYISFYGFSVSEYNKIHGSDTYHVAKKNLEYMLRSEVRERHGGTISIRLLHLDEMNTVDLPGYRAQAAEFKKIVNQHSNVITHDAYLMSYAGKGIPQKRATRLPCSVVWGQFRRELNITWDWNVVPCCLDSDNGVVFGNLHTNTLEQIFSGERYQKFVKAHWDDNLAAFPLCANCERNIAGEDMEVLSLAAWQIQQKLAQADTKKLYSVIGDNHYLPSLITTIKSLHGGYVDFFDLVGSSFFTTDTPDTSVCIFIVSQAKYQASILHLVEKLCAHLPFKTQLIPVIGCGYTEPITETEILSNFITSS